MTERQIEDSEVVIGYPLPRVGGFTVSVERGLTNFRPASRVVTVYPLERTRGFTVSSKRGLIDSHQPKVDGIVVGPEGIIK